MPVRMLTQNDFLDFHKIQSVAFVFPLDVEECEKRILETPDLNSTRIGYFNEDQVLTACMGLPEYQMMYEGNLVKMVGIGGVASLPEYRHGGAVRQIIDVALRRMYEGGAVFSALYPFSHSYYRKFGYELVQQERTYELPIETLKCFRFAGQAHMHTPGKPLDGLQNIFSKHFHRYNMAIERGEDEWKKRLGSDPYKDRIYTYVLTENGAPYAYATLMAGERKIPEKLGIVREMGFLDKKGLHDLLGFLYRLAAQFSTLRIMLPDDIPLASLVDECYDLKPGFHEQQMTRVVNLKKALELLRHPDGAAYTLRVADDGLAENNGFFAVQCDGGNVKVENQTDCEAPNLTADIRTMAQLLLGYLSIEEAMYKKDVWVQGNLDTLRAVFTKRQVFLTDHF